MEIEDALEEIAFKYTVRVHNISNVAHTVYKNLFEA